MNIGNNQYPFVKKKQYTDGEYDKKTITIDNNGNYVPNAPTNNAILVQRKIESKTLYYIV